MVVSTVTTLTLIVDQRSTRQDDCT